MATYFEIQQTTVDEKFQAVVRRALHKAATDIIAEDPSTTNHTARVKWAQKFRTKRIETGLDVYCALILDNATLQGEITVTNGVPSWASTTSSDSDVQFVVNSLIEIFADLP